jgi:hypothetical protein
MRQPQHPLSLPILYGILGFCCGAVSMAIAIGVAKALVER